MEDRHQSVFVMTVNNSQELVQTRLLIQSLRTFGGALRNCPVWVFVPDKGTATSRDFEGLWTEVYPLTVPDTLRHYWFAHKVCACAQAEGAATPGITSLIWFSYDCLIIQPTLLLQLNSLYDAAFRPVHGTNIGFEVSKPLDYFWQTIYEMIDLPESKISVESYVDQQHIRAYFNSHIFSWNPSTSVGQRWFQIFTALVCDPRFSVESLPGYSTSGYLKRPCRKCALSRAITYPPTRL